MKRNLFRAAATVAAAGLSTLSLFAATQEGEMKLLFDGKTLNGWTTGSGKPVTSGWEVTDDGTIHRVKKVGDIITAQKYENFVLEFEYKAAPGTNSGVKYRFDKYGNERIGLEYQVEDYSRAAHPPTKPNIHTTAALYDLFAPAPLAKPAPETEWNTGKIVMAGNHIEHWRNGEKLLDITIGSPEWNAALAKSKFKAHADFGTHPGPILLQEHGGEVWFRNLRLRELKPGETP